jgi:hypothetical protein
LKHGRRRIQGGDHAGLKEDGSTPMAKDPMQNYTVTEHASSSN